MFAVITHQLTERYVFDVITRYVSLTFDRHAFAVIEKVCEELTGLNEDISRTIFDGSVPP